jgi:glycerol kinase
VGDANSSIIGECAFQKGDVVITIGTGAFISVNIGDKPLSSDNGFHSPVTCKHLNKEIFIFHNAVSSAGAAIEWAKSIGKINYLLLL